MKKRRIACAAALAAACITAPMLTKAGSGSNLIPTQTYGTLVGSGRYDAYPGSCSASASVQKNPDRAQLEIKVTFVGNLGSTSNVRISGTKGALSLSNPGIGIPFLDDAAPLKANYLCSIWGGTDGESYFVNFTCFGE